MTAPLLVTQRTAPAVLGLSSRRFLALVKRKGIRCASDGRLVLCKTADVLAALGLSDSPAPEPAWSPDEIMRALHAGGGRR